MVPVHQMYERLDRLALPSSCQILGMLFTYSVLCMPVTVCLCSNVSC